MDPYIPKPSNSLKNPDDIARIILKIVCSHPGCQIELLQLQLELRRCRNVIPNDISTFLNDYKYNFIVNDNMVIAFTRLEICPKYCKRDGYCDEEYCDNLHICKFFLLSHCKFNQNGIPCKFGHNLDSDHNKMLVQTHLLDQLSTEEFQRLFQNGNSRSTTTMPLICRFYNHHNGCMKSHACPHLHICQYYIDGSCKFGSGCKRNHDLNNQVKRILIKFGINTSRRPKDILRDLRMSLPSYSRNQHTLRKFSSLPVLAQQGDASFLSSHDRFKPIRRKQTSEGPAGASSIISTEIGADEICMYNLRNSNGCSFGNSCKRVHKSLAYQWQYQEGSNIEWIDFEEFTNKKLESHFRDVTCSECTILFEDESSEDSEYSDEDDDEEGDTKDKEDGEKGEITVDFHTMKAFVQGRQLSIRRLGTASQAALPPQIARSFHDQVTRWLWYWYDEEQKEWIEYGEKGSSGLRSGIDSSDIDKAFAEDPNGHFDFVVGKTNYRMKFKDMIQKNKETRAKKYIRRRPQPLY